MVINVGIIRVLFDRILETLESLFWIPLLHVNTSNLHQTLRERWNYFDGLEEVFFSTDNVTTKEFECAAQIKRLSLAGIC